MASNKITYIKMKISYSIFSLIYGISGQIVNDDCAQIYPDDVGACLAMCNEDFSYCRTECGGDQENGLKMESRLSFVGEIWDTHQFDIFGKTLLRYFWPNFTST